MAHQPRPGQRLPSGPRDDTAWRDALANLREYAERHGHSYPDPGARTADGRRLATWASNARYAYHRGSLSADRIQALERVPGWVWRSKSPRRRLTTGLRHWDSALPVLLAWVAEHGAVPPVSTVTADGFELGRFVRNCRQHARRLDAGQRATLAALPGWSWHVTADQRAGRADRLERARMFVAEHRYLPQLDASDTGERDLARWLRRYQPRLAAELAEIRAAAVPDSWLRRYRTAATGATDKSTVEWMSRQRAAYRRGTLPAPHRELFTRLRGSHERRWQQRAEEIRTALGNRVRPGESALGWYGRQRHRDRAGRLTPAQSAELVALTALLSDFRTNRPPVRCQAPGCDNPITPPSRGRTPRFCGAVCRSAARTAAADSPVARSAAAIIRLVPALQRIAAGHRTGLPALTRRVQRAADRFADAGLRPPPRQRRRQHRWHARMPTTHR